MPEIYVYNGTTQQLDLTSSFADLLARRSAIVPPGSQGHFTVDAQSDLDAVLAHLNRYGAVPHATLSNPTTFAGVSHSTAVVAVGAKAPTVVEVAPPAKAPPKQPTQPAKK